MPKDTKTKTQTSRSDRSLSAEPSAERLPAMINLVEIRPGLYLNAEQIVSVRVLAQEENNVYAILQMSNGDKHNLTRSEFFAISGKEPRSPARLSQNPLAK